MITAPTIGNPYGLSRNPMISASIAAFGLCSIKNEPNATNTQIVIMIYSSAVPMPNKNVRKAVKIDKIILIGNKLKPETVSIYLRFFIMYFNFGDSITSSILNPSFS